MTDTPATSADIHALHNDLYALGTRVETALAPLKDILAAIKAGGVVAAPVAGTAPTPTAADPYFPAHAGDALFPSPENSHMVREADGTISGRPYLIDSDGTVHTLGAQHVPAFGWYVGGKEIPSYYSEQTPPGVCETIIVRQGKVYGQANTGNWVWSNPAMGGNTYNTSLPDAWAAGTSASTPVTPPAAIQPVAPSAVQPGTSGTVLTAAPGQIAAVLATAKDGDTLVLDGQYAEPVPAINVALKVQLKAGTVLDFTNQTLAQGKGGFVPTKDFWLDGPGTIKGAGIKEAYAGGTAGVRFGAACNIKITGGVTFTGNQNGVSGGDGVGSTLLMEDVTLDGNGLGDGQTHNIYAFAGMAKLVWNRVTSKNAKVGHEFKSRCGDNTLTDCILTDAPAGMYGDDSTVLDLPDGGNLVLNNCTITKLAGALNHGLVGLGMESKALGVGTLTMKGGTIDAECDSPTIQSANAGVATLSGVTIKGTKPVGQGATVTIS